MNSRRIYARFAVIVQPNAPLSCSLLSALQASLSDIAAALGLAQLRRIELLLARRKRVERWYYQYVQSFEASKTLCRS